jgi:hypothetical protein
MMPTVDIEGLFFIVTRFRFGLIETILVFCSSVPSGAGCSSICNSLPIGLLLVLLYRVDDSVFATMLCGNKLGRTYAQ